MNDIEKIKDEIFGTAKHFELLEKISKARIEYIELKIKERILEEMIEHIETNGYTFKNNLKALLSEK